MCIISHTHSKSVNSSEFIRCDTVNEPDRDIIWRLFTPRSVKYTSAKMMKTNISIASSSLKTKHCGKISLFFLALTADSKPVRIFCSVWSSSIWCVNKSATSLDFIQSKHVHRLNIEVNHMHKDKQQSSRTCTTASP